MTTIEMNEITEVTRLAIFDYLTVSGTNWAGRMEDDEFLSRLYNLESMRSTDTRFPDAARDIWQHRVLNPGDWEDHWVFYDRRIDLLHASDDEFLRFVCDAVHPIVRSDKDESRSLVEIYNGFLEVDGWQIIEAGHISGRPVFAPLKVGQRVPILEELVTWERVQLLIKEAKGHLQAGLYQRVGSACRDALLCVAQEVRTMEPELAAGLQVGNVREILDALLKTKRPGKSNERLRAYARTPWNLAQNLQHDTMADYISAALCLEATASTAGIAHLLVTYDRREDSTDEIDDLPF